MNEIILAPYDVISKIKQNSSDMNEIILAPCDAGYVQSCTGLQFTTALPKSNKNGCFDIIHFFTRVGKNCHSGLAFALLLLLLLLLMIYPLLIRWTTSLYAIQTYARYAYYELTKIKILRF
jgi:hypothetical protein